LKPFIAVLLLLRIRDYAVADLLLDYLLLLVCIVALELFGAAARTV
jgi:hypothetical protein